MRLGFVGTLACAVVLTVSAPVQALSILPQFRPQTTGPDNDASAGGGNIQDIFAAAAGVWEASILDDAIITIGFGWVPGASGLGFSDGESVFISRDNDWFLDATPHLSEEYERTTSGTATIDGISVNYNVGFSGASGAAAGFDLFSIALHEIGHVLSFALNQDGAAAEWSDGDVDVAAPLPLAGLTLPMHPRCCHLDRPAGYSAADALMYPFFDVSERRLISDADLLFVAQSGNWREVNATPLTPVPEPGTLTLVALGAGLAWRKRLRRDTRATEPGAQRS